MNVTLGIGGYVALKALPNFVTGQAHLMVSTAAPAIASLLLMVGCIFAIYSAVARWRDRHLLESRKSLESLRAIDPKDFEHLVAEAFRRQGYKAHCAEHSGPDGGVDVTLVKDGRKTLVQCKRWRTRQVGEPVVREMLGVMHDKGAQEVIVVTTGDFSEEAEAFARRNSICLMNGPQLWELVQDVQSSRTAAPTAEVSSAPASPACPTCGGTMVRRTARRGANAGNDFWGCASYPGCKGTRDF